MIFTLKIRRDLYRYCGSTEQRALWKTIFFNSGARFMFLIRMCRRYGRNNLLGVIFRIWLKLLSDRKNVEIPHTVEIGAGLYFGHFKNITINQRVQIGENCNIMQGVTLGNESRGSRTGAPVIGDRVLVGPNSVVVGKIKIGNDVLIAPLTLVNFDVPTNSVVLGNPARIISDKGSRGYINKVLEV